MTAASSRPSSSLRWIRDAAVLLAALTFVLTICWLLYRHEAGQIADQQAQRETLRTNLLAQLLQYELRPVANELRLLADGDALRSYLETGSDAALRATIRRARFVSTARLNYDQMTFIDETGQEKLRVDQGGQVVADAALRNQADRAYFRRTATLPATGLYLSSLDLSAENGRVERPLKPVLHFAVPVFDNTGRRRGVYVVNYLAANLIQRLQDAIPTYGQRLRLLNGSGSWIKAGDPALEWGSVLPERAALTLARSDPALWEQIQREVAGQRRGASDLFTWLRIPSAQIVGLSENEVISDEPFLVMASEVSPAEWKALFAGLRQIMMVVVPGLVLLVLLSAWLFRARRNVLAALRSANIELEQRVDERTAALTESYALLQDREDLLEETGRLAHVGGWDFDPVSGEGRWTAEVARIHGLDTSVEPSRQLGLQFYPGESRDRLEAALHLAQVEGKPYDLELQFISARGEHKWVRTICNPVMENGRVLRMRGALQDVTDHKQAEIRLHSQLQRLFLLEQTTRAIGERQDLSSILQVVIRTLEVQMPLDFGCICLYDPADRNLTVVAVGAGSVALAAQMSMNERALIPIDANGLSRCVRGQLVYEADTAAVPFPFPQRLAAGSLRSLVAAPLQIESKVFGVLIAARRPPQSFSSGDCEFMRQLSEHVALAAHQAQLHGALQSAYEDLRNTQQAVLEQERLRVLGQMASGIAHDINNAISPIMLYSDSLLENEPGLSDRARNSLQTIQQAVSDVAETVARMREFYRQREAQSDLRPVDMNELVTQLRELTRARWESMPQQRGIVINLELELTERLPPVQGIESEIREAMTNLVFNAVDAMPAGGRLTIRTRPGDVGQVCVEVCDTGYGMDEETRRRCLEPFFTTKGERGTGLGLAMVYGVMKRHGGEIEIDSAPGTGTTMRLIFTIAEIKDAVAAERALEVPTGLTILLVDDDPILLNSLRETLELDGNTIVIANGGQLGIDTFKRSLQPDGDAISLVITDLGMPHVDGRTVARTIKQLSAATPVVLLTGWGERLLAEGQAPPHVDRVMSKPPRLRDLRKALAELATIAPRGKPPQQ